jgi:hypothetical protein
MQKPRRFSRRGFFEFFGREPSHGLRPENNQAAAETFASVATSEIVFRICEAIW